LQANQAQNRFYNDLEDWLSTITDLQAGESGTLTVPHYLRLDVAGLQKGIERINQTLDEALTAEPAPSAPAPVSSALGMPALSAQDGESMEKLADAVASLVQQMREEQKIVRQWAQAQQVQQNEMQKLILRASKQQPPQSQGPASRFSQAAAVEDE
jgi:hypothetical protein